MRTDTAATGRALLHGALLVARRDLAAAMASALVRQVAFLAIPWLLGMAVEAVSTNRIARVEWIAGILILAVAVEFAGEYGWVWWSMRARTKAAGSMRAQLLDAVLRSSEDDLRAVSDGDGDLLSRGIDDVDRILDWIDGLAAWVLIGTTVVVLVPAIGAMDPALLLVAACCAGVLIGLNLLAPRLYAARADRLAQVQSRRTEAVVDLVAMTVPLRGIGGMAAMVARHHHASAGLSRRVRALAAVSSAWGAGSQAIPLAGTAAGLIVGGLAAIDGRIDVGQLTTFTLWMGTVQLASRATVARLGERASAVVSAHRIAAVLGAPDDLPHDEQRRRARPGGDLRVDDLAVTRDGRRLGPLTFSAAPSTWIALSGPTGSGKTTVLRAMAGLIGHDGSTRLGDVDLGESAATRRLDLVTLVPHDPVLVHGSVRDNLCLGAGPTDPSDAHLLNTCRISCFERVVQRLPDGLDTIVGERGEALSGGERARLALARALVRRTPLLLLDDITAAVDVPTEQLIIQRLRAATAGQIVVWAGHRASVQEAADQVVELSSNQAVELAHG